ncbi:hypothetical protein ZHAS_00007490 [Anopheles sinensis]|uniref:Uncharacterized protein n=1 Tax=Anopheles sinensis TaxID=74873 RepID=A0A084VPW7_ANOSI|nr:hypothetical protein ZHAS_00007490 [Anopheles sinensis]
MDMYLTRRGCNEAMNLPQVPLQHRSKYHLLMPRVQRINYNLQFLKPYQPAVWYMFFALTIIAAILNWIFWKQLELNIIMVIVFGDGEKSSRFTALLVVAIQIFKFILLEAYLGQVTSFMVLLRYQEDPQTLEQFFESDTLLNEPIIFDKFISTLSGDLPVRMRKKLIGTRASNYTFFYEPGHAYIVTEYAADMIRNHRSYESLFNSSHFYILNEPLLEIQMCYFFCMWSKFEAKFVEYLGQLYANGVILKIMSEAWRLARKRSEVNVTSVLLFSDLVPVFYFLCYGWILGIVFLVVELTVDKISREVKLLKRFKNSVVPFYEE